MDDGARRIEIDTGAEIVAAKPDGRDTQPRFAEIADFHDVTLLLSVA